VANTTTRRANGRPPLLSFPLFRRKLLAVLWRDPWDCGPRNSVSVPFLDFLLFEVHLGPAAPGGIKCRGPAETQTRRSRPYNDLSFWSSGNPRRRARRTTRPIQFRRSQQSKFCGKSFHLRTASSHYLLICLIKWVRLIRNFLVPRPTVEFGIGPFRGALSTTHLSCSPKRNSLGGTYQKAHPSCAQGGMSGKISECFLEYGPS